MEEETEARRQGVEREAEAKAFPPAPCEWAGMSCFVKVLSSKQFNPAARSLMETPRPRVERYFRWGRGGAFAFGPPFMSLLSSI